MLNTTILNVLKKYPWTLACGTIGGLSGTLVTFRQQQYRNDPKLVDFTNIVGGGITYGAISALGGTVFGPIGLFFTASGGYSQFIYLDPQREKN